MSVDGDEIAARASAFLAGVAKGEELAIEFVELVDRFWEERLVPHVEWLREQGAADTSPVREWFVSKLRELAADIESRPPG